MPHCAVVVATPILKLWPAYLFSSMPAAVSAPLTFATKRSLVSGYISYIEQIVMVDYPLPNPTITELSLDSDTSDYLLFLSHIYIPIFNIYTYMQKWLMKSHLSQTEILTLTTHMHTHTHTHTKKENILGGPDFIFPWGMDGIRDLPSPSYPPSNPDQG